MSYLKIFCVIACLFCIAASLSGVASITVGNSGTTVTRLDTFGRIGVFASAFVFAAFAYGIHHRKPMTWPAGFALLVVVYVGVVTASVLTLSASNSGNVAVALTVLFGGAVAIFWGAWWKRQRAYFH